MKFSLPILVLAFALVDASAQQISSKTFAGKDADQSTFTYRGVKYVTSIPSAPSSPIWIPGNGQVPLSPEDAFKLADTQFQKDFAQFRSFTLREIHLLRRHSSKDFWIYEISYVQGSEDAPWIQTDAHSRYQENLIIVYYVFLDGKVHYPKAE